MSSCRLVLALGVAAGLIGAAACGGGSGSSRTAATPTSPSIASSASAAASAVEGSAGASEEKPAGRDVMTPSGAEPTVVTFPPRDEAFRFRQDLEAYYRDILRRSTTSSFVDIEGTIVWTQEYLRYRVNGCTHDQALSRVMAQIDGSTNTSVCSTTETPFPPRNEPFAFRQSLEAKYRDGLRRSSGSTFVDTEGDIVWTQEYLRYRTTGCTDAQATDRVRSQLGGGAPPAGCSTTTTSTTSTSTTTIPGTTGPTPGTGTISASFSVSGLSNGACALDAGGGSTIAFCTFNAAASTPGAGATLTNYIWTIGARTFSGQILSNPVVGCGFGAGVFSLPVTLTITDSMNRTATATNFVAFRKDGGC
jgi:hypothetical protein